jgi:hypothetical protein
MGTETGDRLRGGEPRAWAVVALAIAFFGIGILFVAAPAVAASVFGIPAPVGPAEAYIRAIGFRDLALALYLAGLAAWSTRGALSLVLGASVLIPVCDIALVALVSGPSLSLLLHAAAGACLAGLAWWVRPVRSSPGPQ